MNDINQKNTANRLTMYVYLTLLIITVYYLYYFITRFEKVIVVKKIYMFGEYKITTNMISDKENNLYKITNQPLLLSFDSAEILSNLQPNKKYKINGFGIRVPFLGLYNHVTEMTGLD
jgi:hypothetical protein